MKRFIIIFFVNIFLLSTYLYSANSVITINSGASITLTAEGGNKSYLINSGADDGQIIVNSGASFTCWAPEALVDFTVSGDGDITLPVVLSTFTTQYLNDIPTLGWTTQSETNNAGWNIFRSENDSLEQSLQINPVLISRAGTCTQPTEYTFEDELPVQADSTYLYWLESVAISGISNTYGPISLTIPGQGNNHNSPEIPKVYGLYQNYPNPFNPDTEIGFALKEDTRATLIIYNLKGQKVVTLLNNEPIEKDKVIRVNWNSKDANGNKVASGIYLYELQTNKEDYIRKMILMK